MERGIDYFSCGWMPRGLLGRSFVDAIRNDARKRERLVIVGWTNPHIRESVGTDEDLTAVLRDLGTDHLDVLLLSLGVAIGTDPHASRFVDDALELKRRGLVRFVGVMGQDPGTPKSSLVSPEDLGRLVDLLTEAESEFDVLHAPYNASTSSMERPFLSSVPAEQPPAIMATGTAHRGYVSLLRSCARDERVPTWEDCYRFALSHPAVSGCVSSVHTPAQLDRALAALDRGPMTEDEIEWMRRLGGAAAHLNRVKSAVGSIVSSQRTFASMADPWLKYRREGQARYAATLKELVGIGGWGVDEELASGQKDGYRFGLKVGEGTFVVTARPVHFGKTGVVSFYADQDEDVRYTTEDREATAADSRWWPRTT